MLSDIDKQCLKYEILINFCEKHNITDIDAHYYLKLAYEKIKDQLSEEDIMEILNDMYYAFDEHFYDSNVD